MPLPTHARTWFLVFPLCLSALAADPASGRWPQFRGANADGTSTTARPPAKFGPAEGVRWSIDLPWSPSSPIVWGDRIFLTTFADQQLETRCLNRTDGSLRWKRGLQVAGLEEFHRSDGSPAASTPATDGQRVVSYFGSFGVICHDLDGRELWRHPLPVAQSGGQYGTGGSPVIMGGLVVLNRDQYRDSTLLALDLATGAKRWEAPRPDSSGSFGTPVYWKNDGHDEVVIAATGRLRGYDLKTGAERWVVKGVTGYVCTTPVIGDGVLYFAAFSNGQTDSPLTPWPDFVKRWDKNGDGEVAFEEIDENRRDYLRGLDRNRDGKYTKEDWDQVIAESKQTENVLVAVKSGGTGDITTSHVLWRYKKALPYVPSPLLYEGRIFFVRDGGLVTSLDAKTGTPFYAQERIEAPGNYYASPVAAAGRIYVASVAGKLTVLKAGGDKPEIVLQIDFGSRILASPVLVDDTLYLRTANRLFAFGS